MKQWIPEHRRDMLFEHSRRWVEHNKKWHTGKLQIGIGEELKSEREQLLSHQAFLDNSINHTNRLPRPSPPLSGAISIARPTFIKVNRKYLEPETLDTYAIEWESDDVCFLFSIHNSQRDVVRSLPSLSSYLVTFCGSRANPDCSVIRHILSLNNGFLKLSKMFSSSILAGSARRSNSLARRHYSRRSVISYS